MDRYHLEGTMLSKWIFSFFILLSLNSFASERSKVVVLVPGFFNSLAPSIGDSFLDGFEQPYWSQTIVNTFKEFKVPVYVVNNLLPVGDIYTNGALLVDYLNEVVKQQPNSDLYLVGHSAGGLYSLYAASTTQLPIKSISTVSTPFGGVKFIDEILENPERFQDFLSFFHLESLIGLKKESVDLFKSQIRVPDDLKVTAYGGFQTAGLPLWDAQVMSTLLLPTYLIINEDCDGIVAWKSSFAANNIKTKSEKAFNYEVKNDYIHLDHWEQVLDYRFFKILGILNIDYVQKEQQRFFTNVAHDMGL